MIHADLPFQPEQIGAPAALKRHVLTLKEQIPSCVQKLQRYQNDTVSGSWWCLASNGSSEGLSPPESIPQSR